MGKILVIENDTSWFAQFKKIIQLLGESREIDRIDFSEFQVSYKSAESFKDIDYCFIDIELGPAINPDINDMWGYEIVLPRIRQYAPWLPCACISRYLTGKPEIIASLGVLDFDGIYPKKVITEGSITNPNFNAERWEEMLYEMSIKRISSITGNSVFLIKSLVDNYNQYNINLSDGVKSKGIIKNEDNFKQLLSILNLGGTRISVDETKPGFSGAEMVRFASYGEDENGKIQSYWILKWSHNIIKLEKESLANRLLFMRGLHRSLMVPMLYPHVINWKGIAYIIYPFENEATTALEYLRDNMISSLQVHLSEICKGLYSHNTINSVSPSDILIKWCNLSKEILASLYLHGIERNYEITSTLIHGDLHLRNIMISSARPVLIDFARSSVGPIAVDAAKLTIDTLVFISPHIINTTSLSYEGILEEADIGCIIKPFVSYLTQQDDKKMFDLALIAYAITYSTYSDVSDNIRKELDTSIINAINKWNTSYSKK